MAEILKYHAAVRCVIEHPDYYKELRKIRKRQEKWKHLKTPQVQSYWLECW